MKIKPPPPFDKKKENTKEVGNVEEHVSKFQRTQETTMRAHVFWSKNIP